MKSLYVLLILLGVSIVSVLVVSGIKYIIKAVFKKKGKDFNAKALEYPLAAGSFVLAFLSAFLLLYLHFGEYANMNEVYSSIYSIFKTDNKIIGDVVYSSLYAGLTPLLYTIIQSPRKFIKWIIAIIAIIKAKGKDTKISDIKESLEKVEEELTEKKEKKDAVANLLERISDMNNSNN